MKKLNLFLAAFTMLFIILNGIDLKSLPSSSFIIIPSGISSSAYTNSRSTYKVESSDEDFILAETANQHILSAVSGDGKTEITVSTGNSPIPADKNLNIYLKNTPYLNTDKESIKKTAAQFKNSKNPLNDVSVFIYRHISDKKMGIPLMPAASILTGRAGDCTEHTILAVSLLRTLKIPSRAVMGIILSEKFSGRQNVFVYHMWIEAYQNGKWVMADPTRPYDTHPNRYIALAYHNLMTETPLEYLQAASTMQNMKITYIK
jgi:hypothetical protein